MDPVVVVAIIGVASTVLAGLVSAWAARGQIGVRALELATATYQADNAELRTRVFAAEQHVVELTAKVYRCESDKTQLTLRVAELERREQDR